MADVTSELMQLAGGDPFDTVLVASDRHRREHGCNLYSAGPAVMQVAASYVRAARAGRVLDLGCGLGYSTLWLAAAATPGEVIGIDSDEQHVDLARRHAASARLETPIEFILGEVSATLPGLDGPFDSIHDDAWFARVPAYLDTMLDLLRPGGVVTMPNWFLLIDAISGQPRNDWTQFAGQTWAVDVQRYAALLAGRTDVSAIWITEPPLGVLVKR